MKKLFFVSLVLLTVLAASSAMAVKHPLGVRAGYTSWDSISQFHVGGHAMLGELFPNVDLTPGFEIGFGEDTSFLTVNGDLYYKFTELTTAPWGLYGGGSLSFNYMDYNGYSDTHLGLSALAGVTKDLFSGNQVMVELRAGIMDSPTVKLTLGYTFF